jgi:hypothetical protein
MHFNFMPTYTGPGHASIYTGTTPDTHGIVGNEWFSRTLGEEMYCTDDASVSTLGGTKEEGEMSPKNLLTTILPMSCVWELTLKESHWYEFKDRGAISSGSFCKLGILVQQNRVIHF